MSLRLRLALIYGALLILIVAAFGAVLFAAMGRALSAEMDRRLEVRASQVELAIWPATESLTSDDVTSAHLDLSPLTSLNAPTLYVQILERDGHVVARSTNLEAADLPIETDGLSRALAGQRAFGDVVVEDSHPVRILSVPILTPDRVAGVLQVGQSRLPLRRTLEDLGVLLVVLGLGAVAAGGAVCWFVADRALRPLQTMALRAGGIAAEGDFHRRVGPVSQTDEIGMLAATVDHLLQTVEATLQKHGEFVADTSHELRNPLSSIQANLELLEKMADPKDQAECVAEASRHARRMSRLVADLLLLARADANLVVERQLVALQPTVKRIAAEAHQRAEGRTIELGRCDPIHLQADEGRVGQMLENLIDNAIQHTDSGGRIGIRLERQGRWARLSVTDDGEGIAEQDLPHIFERFYRARDRNRRGRQGTGLGLAIVKHLAEAHDGKVAVESSLDTGSVFSVWLPLSVETQPIPEAELGAAATVGVSGQSASQLARN